MLFLYILQHLGEECLQTRVLGVGEQLLRRLILLDPSLVNEDVYKRQEPQAESAASAAA